MELDSISEEEITWHENMRKSSPNPEIPESYERLVHARFSKEAVKKLFLTQDDCSFLKKCKSCPVHSWPSRLIIRKLITLLLTSVANLRSLGEIQAWLVSRKKCCGKPDKAMETYQKTDEYLLRVFMKLAIKMNLLSNY